MRLIDAYAVSQQVVNAAVGSEVVSDNLEKGLGKLRRTVEDSFACLSAEAAVKQKASSKSLQYEAYQGRRAKN